jgi:DNA polymerase-3 subunit alpha
MHSDYSLLDSCTKFSEYVDLAIQNGQKAIASTEHGKPLGWVSKKLYCDSVGIRFIHGVEIYLTESLTEKVRDNYHTVLLARNLDGVYELNRLVSMSCDKDHFYYTNRLSFDEFLGISDNIVSTSACLASPLNKLQDSHPYYERLARKYDFLEIQAHNHPDQIAFNKRLYELSRRLGKPLIAGTDTHSSSSYKAECRSILLKSKHKNYGDEDKFDLSYKTYDELLDMFAKQNALPEAVYTEAVLNTNLLYDMTEDFELDRSIKYPILYGTREADDRKFTETVEQKFAEKVESGIIFPEQVDAFRSAIDEEMRVFRKLNMTGFMLSMSELICWCKSQGMAIGTARGSVGGSRVAYVTDIIDLNPETWHTVFSRFANEDRVEIGD